MKVLHKTRLTALILAGLGMGLSGATMAATTIKVAFNQSNQHPQYQALEDLGKAFSKATDGKYKLNVFPNEMLGDQRAALELVQNGAIQMAMVANPLVENYDETFRVIGMPYIYKDAAHQEKVFTSGVLDKLFASTKQYGFEVLTAYTAGARSIYTKDKPIKQPAELDGEKIRVMQSDTMIKMLDCLGGTGVPMSQGEVYTAVQQGVLDGGENNEITYADLKHYEVAPYFSETRHLMVPDLLVVSTNFMQSLSPENQKILRELAKESTKEEFKLWQQQIEKAKKTAKDGGATFTNVDIQPFRERCKPLQQALAKTPAQKALLEKIEALQ